MVAYYGDFAEDDTVLIPFNTFSSDDPAASVTITNLADADIKVHKDGSTTEIATDGATVAIDFDGVTGNHLVTIDTSVHADYSTGSEYAVRIEGTTVDAGTVNAWIGSFSIERAGGALALIKAGNLSANVVQISGDSTAADNLEADYDGTGYNKSNSTIGTCTANTDMRGTDSAYTGTPPTAAAIADAVLDESLSGHVSPGTLGKAVADIETDAAAIEVDTQDLQTQIGTAGAGLTDLGGMSTAMKAEVNAEADTAISDAALATAANLATVDTNVDAIKAVTDQQGKAVAEGTVGTGSTTTTIVSGLTTVADQYNGKIITFLDDTTTAALRNQSTDITDTDASGNLTVTALTDAPVNGDTFILT